MKNCIAYRDPRGELFNTLKKETNLFLDSVTPSSAFTTLISMKQGEKRKQLWLNTYVIACRKEEDALNITLSNCINSTNVHLSNYCTKIFVIVVKTCVCRRSVENKAAILSYPTRGNKGNRGCEGNKGNRGEGATRGTSGNMGNRGTGELVNKGNRGKRGTRETRGNKGRHGKQGQQGGTIGTRGDRGNEGNKGKHGEQGNW